MRRGLPSPEFVVLCLIGVSTLLRLGFAASLGLGVDESYMIAAGRTLSLGYFDHPPAAWWLSWGAAHLFGTEAPVAVRLPFIAMFGLSTWLMYRLGAAFASPWAGFCAALLLNLSPVFGVTTGTWVLPDGPLDCALLGAALCMLHALPARPGTAPAWGWWSGAGLCAGLALFSKYSALLCLGGAGIYLLTSREHRRWLARPEPWLALLIAVAVFAPVVVWNAQHHFASFAFQGDRAAGFRFRPLAPFTTWAGEALFVLPWIWAPLVVAFIAALWRGPAAWRSWLLCCLGAPPVLLFSLIAAWSSGRVLFHWAAPGYLMLFPLLGAEMARRLDQLAVRRVLAGTIAFIVAGVIVVSTAVRFDWLHPVIAHFSRKDPVIEAVDWTSLRVDLARRGLLQPGTVVGVPNWRNAGKIAYALGPDVTTVCLNRDARQFAFSVPAASHIGQNILILAPEHPDRVPAELGPAFGRIEPLSSSPVLHAGRVLQEVAVFRGQDLRAWPPD